MVPVRIWLAVMLSLVCLPTARARAAVQPGSYAWPVRGSVIRPFEEPSSPYGSGHRGIDIAAAFGTDMVAAQDGVVSFAGWVAGALFISIDHADGFWTLV
jgi:murein DD-endopeptidase MepM/ murein hydrolase activator NlpD